MERHPLWQLLPPKLRDTLLHVVPNTVEVYVKMLSEDTLMLDPEQNFVVLAFYGFFSGTYRLCHPYYPSPRELWGKDFVEPKERTAAKAEPSPK